MLYLFFYAANALVKKNLACENRPDFKIFAFILRRRIP